MSRIRTIKPSFWNDAKVVKLPVETRLLFIGIWNFADDFGWLWDDTEQIHRDVFPADPNIDVPSGIARLLMSGLLETFPTGAGRDALHVRKWDVHQRVDKPKASDIARSVESFREASRGFDVEGKGREGKLSEGSVESVRESSGSPSGGSTPPSSSADPSKALVTYYFNQCKSCGYEPTQAWRGQLGNQAKRLLAEKPLELVEAGIRVIADEKKQPATLAHVIADIEAGRSANAEPA